MAVVVAAAVAACIEVICKLSCAIFNNIAKIVYDFEITSVRFNFFICFLGKC